MKDDYCIGHITKPLNNCYACKYDEKNKECEKYQPSRIEIIVIKTQGTQDETKR